MAYQLAEFGQNVLRVTQGPNGATSHVGRQAIDFGGANYGGAGAVDKWYARGCTWRVMQVQQGGDHFVYYQTTLPVLWADGSVDYAVLALCHQDVITQKVGQLFLPGEVMYTEGTYSGGRRGAVGAHIHCQVGRGEFAGPLMAKPYRLPNEARIQDLFYISYSTSIADSGGLRWVHVSEAPALADGNTTGTQEEDMKIKIFAPTGKTPSSQLLKEGWILDGAGRMFNPHGGARMVKEYEGDISIAFEAMKQELQPDEILMAVG